MKTLTENYTKALHSLNAEQLQAVHTTEGPVMVIAGPGTGKTQILACRIGYILENTDADPTNILCLTYTDAGAVAMRKRLLSFIGAATYQIKILTFHGFCNEIIQNNLGVFQKNNLDAVSDLERINLLRELIDNFPENHLLKRYKNAVYFDIDRLKNLFSVMKREGLKAAEISDYIDMHLMDIQTEDEESVYYKEFRYARKYKEFNKGDFKAAYGEYIKRMEVTRAAAMEFDNYAALMEKAERYDFDDMINWVIEVFEKEENQNLLLSYQERFQYVMVDEFQDSSNTQNKLVQILMDFWGEQANVFVVGDDDQSIYRFQGANIENITNFVAQYKANIKSVVLTDNYRSTAPILDAATTLIAQNGTKRLIADKKLFSKNKKYEAITMLPSITEYPNPKHEYTDVCQMIETLINTGTRPQEIAVIYHKHAYGEEMAQFLRLKNIPISTKRKLNLLEVPLSAKIINILRYLAAEMDAPQGGESLLFEILHYDFLGLQPLTVSKLTYDVSHSHYTAQNSIRKAIAEIAAKNPTGLFADYSENMKLSRASLYIEKILKSAFNDTLQTCVETIIKEGILAHCLNSAEKLWNMQVITALFDFVKDETHRMPKMNIKTLIENIELMEANGLRIDIYQSFGIDNGVNFMTAHGSKGLEFEHVFIIGANSGNWEKKRNAGMDFKLPDSIYETKRMGVETTEDALLEQRRLFYVAMTRAKTHLYISYCLANTSAKELLVSQFITELLVDENLKVNEKTAELVYMLDFNSIVFKEDRKPYILKEDYDYIEAALQKFTMNATALNNYLDCPIKFYYSSIIRIPQAQNQVTTFGTATHYALQQLFEKMKKNNNVFPEVEVFLKDFEWMMKKSRECFTQKQYDLGISYGRKILPEYYKTYINQWNKIVSLEVNISGALVGDVPLKGQIDKLEFDGKKVNIIDYKTGKYDAAKLKGPKADKKTGELDNGGQYWRQAVFYKLMLDNNPNSDWKTELVQFSFIEPHEDKYILETVNITEADELTVKKQIKETWDKIKAHDFYKGCGKATCHHCNFVKNNFDASEFEILANEIVEEVGA